MLTFAISVTLTCLLFALTAPTLLRWGWRLLTWPFRQVREFAYGFRHHEEVFADLEAEAALRRLSGGRTRAEEQQFVDFWVRLGRGEAGRDQRGA